MTQTTPHHRRGTSPTNTAQEGSWKTPTGTETETVTPPTIDWRAKIEALERTLFMTANTGEAREAAQKTAEPKDDAEANWQVNWKAVRETEAWLEKEWAAGRRGFAGPPDAYDILPSAVPEEVGQIGGVLLARCAGYARTPKPRDVVAAVDADTPTEQQWYALQTYLLEATSTEVRTACQAGEIDLRKLIRRVQEIIERDGLYGLRSVEQWLTR